MDPVSMRRKARQRAAARAGEQEAAQPAAPSGAAAPPGAQEPAIEDALRAELERLGTAPPSPATMPGPPPEPAPPPAPALPAPPAPEALLDPLREFFWREDEPAPNLPDLGSAGAERSPAGSPTGELREHVAFLLGAEEYAVAIGRVREILKPPPITEVPRAPRHVLGVIAVRGEVVAVVDPRPRLALPPGSPGPSSRIVVCEGAGGPVGLLVDAVSQVVRLPPEAVEPRPPGVGGEAADVIAGIGRDGERLVILLDLDALLGAPAAREGAA
jgi:purine-binding chemotaxis protein CheW